MPLKSYNQLSVREIALNGVDPFACSSYDLVP